ncbi:MBL fold metallo-hydrolase [Chenggangzhangella methanolivorans]|uniref:MBL fold metallo-hydrolase n=1 Tax=Chenggangzhangella methanolivorans TaxID=1437009 RepID=UPI0036088ED5
MARFAIDRRKAILSAAAGASALSSGIGFQPSALGQPATPVIGNASTYRFKVGEIVATVLSDGQISGPPRVYASDAPEPELTDALRRAFLPTDRMTLDLNVVLVETGGRRILLEAGAGGTMGPNGGRLVGNLAALGLRAEDIDVIVVSHTHPDHVGNLRSADGVKAFPRATVLAPKADWDFFVRSDPDLSYMPVPADFRKRFTEAIKRSVEPIAREIELYEAGDAIAPGLTTIAAPGHTPGMATFLIDSGAEQAILTADLAYHPVVNIDNAWKPGPDRDKDAALASRKRIFDRASADRMLVLGFHYPFPGLGRLLKTATGYTWVPSPWRI